ncbi:DNA polymerase III subunit gamma/tau [Saccharibacter sp. 17.LH.SD]|uniref:DNA polymerase III subunit gamma/tau n=1 Tax=Saccharibacter sp. 17.LH.SD TaxID=2689393 RepID=UPI00136BB56C|nr:DNA polymerase III subunit gamma/tau [Saccharibacter sp. 17.LH.SD]MXV43723.1 DNA polymerase III subunit gamma/tau [Saccharibacter sp. 17.LH.SD]
MTDDDLPLPPENGGGFLDEEPSSPSVKHVSSPATPYRVLARKYRPQTFEDLIGQDSLVRILRRAFELGRVAHAFMLTGVRGVGKTTTARIIARALNCTGVDGKGGPTSEPCGVCPNCRAILADRHPDVLEMDAASRTGVEDVREIIEAARFRPMQARMKVFIIDEVHMLSRNAFNALLKTLEEPPAQVTFIFATTELRKVPVTVLSRCQRFDLQRVPQKILAEHFRRVAEKEKVELSSEALALIARVADGSVRDGLSLLDQAIAQGAKDVDSVSTMLGLADRGLVFDLLEAAMAGQVAKVLEIAAHAYAHGVDLGVLLADVMDALHVLSRLKALPKLREGLELPEIERVRGGALADRLSVSVLSRAWQLLLKGLAEVEIAPNRQQAAEMVLIRLCYASLLPTPDRLIRQLQQREELSPGGEGGMHHESPPDHSPGGRRASLRGGSALAQERVVSSPALQHDTSPRASLRLVTEDGALVQQAEGAPALPENVAPPVEESTARLMPRTWREMVMLVREEQEPWLHGILRLEAHIVRFAPPEIALRIDDEKVRRRALKDLSRVLDRLYPGKWRVVASEEKGSPTLDEQGAEVEALHREEAVRHPLVQAILNVFPGAKIGDVNDESLDDYGLPPELTMPLGEDASPHLEFAPIDADAINEDDLD